MNPPASAAAAAPARSRSGPRRPALRLATDDALVRRVGAGDAEAFGEVFRRYHQPLYRYCAGLIGNGDDARDALQNTMARALVSLTGVSREIALRPWLYRIAHHESINVLRRRRPDLELDETAPAPGPSPEDAAVEAERWQTLRDDLKALPERQRGALLLREMAGLDAEQIGAAMGTSPAAATQAVHEARESLRASAVGRDTACSSVRSLLDAGDGRRMRSRAIRGHLRSCEACRAEVAAVRTRRRALPVIVPALPALVAARLLETVQAHDLTVAGVARGAGAAGGLVAGVGAGLGGTGVGVGAGVGAGAGSGIGVGVGAALASPAVVGVLAVVAVGGGALTATGDRSHPRDAVAPRVAVAPVELGSRPSLAARPGRPWAAGDVAVDRGGRVVPRDGAGPKHRHHRRAAPAG
ncbi:RNA polymerase sigma factor, partial [Patulibacter defluvii]|uniref:RNA polymerase sigma factor n=1 Tax=Patulibacter defluvii TaxID=3095358 RepID=UPI002A765B17